MRNSKVCSSMKHGHLFQCEDHKKVVKEKPKSNSFVIREVPIRRLCNASSSSDDLSRFTKGKNFSAGMNVMMDYDMPELVVFVQEDPQQFVKDICIDNGIREAMSINESASLNNTTLMDAMKIHDFRNFRMKGKVEHHFGDKISIDHITKMSSSETLREAFKKERELSRSYKKWQKNSFTGTSGSKVECPHCTDLLQVTNTIMYRPAEMSSDGIQCINAGTIAPRPEMSYSQTLTTDSSKIQVDDPQETSNSTSCHAKTSSFSSHKSNDSISSNHSFAFPILPAEWNGSPVRMAEADRSPSRKNKWSKIWPPCCDCDC